VSHLAGESRDCRRTSSPHVHLSPPRGLGEGTGTHWSTWIQGRWCNVLQSSSGFGGEEARLVRRRCDFSCSSRHIQTQRIQLDIGALWYLHRIFHMTCSALILIQCDDRQSTTCRGGGHREVVNNKGNIRTNKTDPDRQGQRNSNSVATPQVGWQLIVKGANSLRSKDWLWIWYGRKVKRVQDGVYGSD
jgi:hypothetical protein